MDLIKKNVTIIISLLLILFIVNSAYAAESPTPTVESTPAITSTLTPTLSPTPTDNSSNQNQDTVNDLQKQINDLQSRLSDTQKQEKTLSSQIAVMDSQVRLTELRINSTKQKLADISEDIELTNKKIKKLETSLTDITKILLNRIIATYEVGMVQPVGVLLSSNDVSDFFKRANYLKLAQSHDKQLIFSTQQAKNDYANQKDIFQEKKAKAEALKKQLENYTVELDQEKKNKQTLLAETQGSEQNYNRLLRQAEAQLASFSKFTQSQGGASLLGNQTVCDDWGCYYNQRDSAWGGSSLNGTRYTLASDGCLVTSMAMVSTHYGHKSVTPATINGTSSNFASYYPAWLKKDISVDGVTFTRVGADLDSILASGNPAVVGISYDGGSLADHFVVFTSGSNGNYKMNDPFTPNGHNISFRERYPNVRIVEVEKVVM